MVYDTFFCRESMGLHQPSLDPQMAPFFTSKVRLLRWGQPGRLGLGGLVGFKNSRNLSLGIDIFPSQKLM